MIGPNWLCYCLQPILNLKQNLEFFGLNLELVTLQFYCEFPQVTDDADLNLVTKAGNL